MRDRRRRILIGSAYFLVGIAALIVAYLAEGSPAVPFSEFLETFPLGNWLLFAIAYFVLSFQSVEVNDRMFASASPMVAITAGVVFVGGGRWPVLALGLVAALSPFVPQDFKERRVFLPAFNFGQLIVSAVAAAAVLEILMPERARYFAVERNAFGFGIGSISQIALAAAAAALVYTIVNLFAIRLGARLVYGASGFVPWSGMGVLFTSQMAMGFLGGFLGVVMLLSGSSIVPLVLAVFVIGHLVFTSYAKLREAHESTLRGFILALEARDLYTRGHTERVAYFCRLIGEQLAFTGTQLEKIRWAAIIHDMGKLAVPVEIMEKQGRLTDFEYRNLRRASHKVDDLLSEVDFLRPMVNICSGAHPRLAEEDFGQSGHEHTTKPTLEQRVLAVADAFDAMTSTRGYRMAFTQSRALSTLRDDETLLYDNDVIDALERGLGRAGQSYGPPDISLESEEAAHA